MSAILVFGLRGFFSKLATDRIAPSSALVWNVLGSLVVGAAVLVALRFRIAFDARGATFAVLTGMTGILGTLLLFAAIGRGAQASIAVPMTALYPLITILLSRVVLHERMNLAQAIGMVLALVAIAMLAYEQK